MKNDAQWKLPGWPWELELLAVIFVITAIAVPVYIYYTADPAIDASELSLVQRAALERQQGIDTWHDQQGFIFGIIIVGIYLAHLAIAGMNIDYNSTSFTHLFSPLVFSLITYYRLLTISRDKTVSASIVSGSPQEIAVWILGVVLITALVARVRMARHMLNFKNTKWDIITPTLIDKSYFAAAVLQFRPLLYPPRTFRLSDEGILLEGWLYVMPIPFTHVHSVDAVQNPSFMSSGLSLATSSHSLVRVTLTDSPTPIIISPTDRDEFVRYCRSRSRTSAASTGTSGQTRGGTAQQ
ncbi:MAG: hypothetical protein KJ626_03435 [Verrucomicrobia bacterium]|nr:hypothetical protein [Verrucomicrobiota bacterium]